MFGTTNGVRSRPLRTLSADDKDFIQRSFQMADGGNKGYLKREELKTAMTALYGYRPSKVEINDLLKRVGKAEKDLDEAYLVEDLKMDDVANALEEENCQLVLDQHTFVNIMSRQMECIDPADDVRETFQYFDSRCKGFIEYKDFEQKVLSFMPHSREQTLIRAFRELDADGDGRISFRDFEYMMEHFLY